MPLDQPASSRRPDPALNLLDNALHDSAVILDAYARFATTMIGALVFPYAAIAPPQSVARQEASETPQQDASKHRGVVQVAIALLIGFVLGRRLFRRGTSFEA